ncbi:hypothetical protein OCS_03215 [Ophiocordyceps sinensis CO18]|uniref:Uncharacterized protein n=1 Tax=Ophiocordyceps sinensis (strain Co18 / CGMCC 3.14243) TaxID=911162 RepID=T5AH21_OPHSC|nr:hypothetical protein OCS_03215 [Ophiocordyceps sinensis CO18]
MLLLDLALFAVPLIHLACSPHTKVPVGDVPAMPTPMPASPLTALAGPATAKQDGKTKEEKKREKKEREAAEKAAKQAEKEREKQAKEAEKEREKQAKEAEKERGRQAKEAEKERERQAKEEEKRRREEKLGGSQPRGSEQDEARNGSDDGKKTEGKEEEPKKKEPNGSGSMSGILDRSKRGSKSMSKRSFSFFHKDKGVGDVPLGGNENGEAPEKQEKTKGRLSIGLGRKKSGNLLP